MKPMEEEMCDMEIANIPNMPLNELLEQFQGLPTALIACNIHQNVFEVDFCKQNFEQMFEVYGPAQFVYLPSFRRVRINYETPQEAAKAKISLHNVAFIDLRMGVYFAQIASPEESTTSTSLQPPVPDKQFLISPPASPPVGWEPVEENKPMFNYDLLTSIVELEPGQMHELHKGTDTTPSVVVHICENTRQSDSTPRPRIQQTRRPDY